MKKSFNKIPPKLLEAISSFKGEPFVIFAVKTVNYGYAFPNLPGLSLKADSGPVDTEVLPDPGKGVWASRNLAGWEIKRKDWPKVTKSFTHESPNFGDWSLGSHPVTVEREVYQTEGFPGHGTTISVRELKRDKSTVTLGLELNRVLADTGDPRELLFALNVFQESVGQTSVKPSEKPLSDYIATLDIDWEILPVGEREEVLRQISQRLRPNAVEAKIIEDRMTLLLSLNPNNLLTGTSGFARYVGALYTDNLVVFENVRYGNAVYIMFEDWARLSKMSRTDLLASNEKFVRVVHAEDWEIKVRTIVREHRALENW